MRLRRDSLRILQYKEIETQFQLHKSRISGFCQACEPAVQFPATLVEGIDGDHRAYTNLPYGAKIMTYLSEIYQNLLF